MAFDPITAVVDLVKTGLNKFVRDKVDEATMTELEQNFEAHVLTEARKENSNFRNFVLEYEGKASDYKDVPFVGPVILIFRGLIRPIITIGTVYFDYLWFTYIPEQDIINPWTADKAKLLFVMNVIVLVFWFGERTLKNTGLIDVVREIFLKKFDK